METIRLVQTRVPTIYTKAKNNTAWIWVVVGIISVIALMLWILSTLERKRKEELTTEEIDKPIARVTTKRKVNPKKAV